MRLDCIVCAGDFWVKKDVGQIICSPECQKKYAEFIAKIRTATPEERNNLVRIFFAKLDGKQAREELQKFARKLKKSDQGGIGSRQV